VVLPAPFGPATMYTFGDIELFPLAMTHVMGGVMTVRAEHAQIIK